MNEYSDFLDEDEKEWKKDGQDLIFYTHRSGNMHTERTGFSNNTPYEVTELLKFLDLNFQWNIDDYTTNYLDILEDEEAKKEFLDRYNDAKLSKDKSKIVDIIIEVIETQDEEIIWWGALEELATDTDEDFPKATRRAYRESDDDSVIPESERPTFYETLWDLQIDYD